ncbi:MAG: hypothetical protein ACAI34_04820 [Verrucomicrobium sp.]|nr:hypothetical protein [Verrucomicrobium sp.]
MCLATVVLGGLLAVTPFAAAQQGSREHFLKLDLAPLLSLPGLWQTSQDQMLSKFSAEGFDSNPYVSWQGRKEGGRDLALFSTRPYGNVSVDLSLFEKKVPVERAMVEFREGKAVRAQFLVSAPGGAAASAEKVQEQKRACEAALSSLFGAPAAPLHRAFGSKSEEKSDCVVWQTDKGVGCLDYSKTSGLLKFSLATSTVGVDALAALYTRDGPDDPLASTDKLAFFLNLDSMLSMPDLWDLTPDKVEKKFAVTGMKDPPYYQWLTADKAGVRFTRRPFGNVEVDLSLFNGTVPVEEAVVEFVNGKAAKVSVSLYNRGDSGEMERPAFEQRYKTAGVAMGKMLASRPTERKPNAQTAIKISGWLWNSPAGLAALEYNTEALTGPAAPEFLRIKLAAPGQRESFFQDSGQTIRKTALGRSELVKFVKREGSGDIYVGGVPMVDQGAKGYCVVASCQRLFGYLRIPCDQHELAQVAETDADRGTNPMVMEEALKKIDSRFKVNFKPLAYRMRGGGLGVPSGTRVADVNLARFQKSIQDYTSKGVPLLWALQLGLFPEEPQISLQAGGGHMRLILGCNAAKGEIIFTDSWGAGHELKRMKIQDAYQATLAVYVIEPKDY